MAGHLTQHAKEVAAAIDAGANLDRLARVLLEEVGTLERAIVVDVGAKKWLIILPGYGALSDPSDFVHVADQQS